MTIIHSFTRSLQWSHDKATWPGWHCAYSIVFPGYVEQDLSVDGWHQRLGLDRKLLLPDTTTVTLDEKLRTRDFGDFLLEIRHIEPNGRTQKGWMEKPLICDYIAYAWEPSQRCFLLPRRELMRAWEQNKHDWWRRAKQRADGFSIVHAANSEGGRHWTTESLCVPIPVLRDSLSEATEITWGGNHG